MLVFGMGLYELFISNLDKSKSTLDETSPYQSNLFGMFTLKVSPNIIKPVSLELTRGEVILVQYIYIHCMFNPLVRRKSWFHHWN